MPNMRQIPGGNDQRDRHVDHPLVNSDECAKQDYEVVVYCAASMAFEAASRRAERKQRMTFTERTAGAGGEMHRTGVTGAADLPRSCRRAWYSTGLLQNKDPRCLQADTMIDHDQRFKTLIKMFFAEFLKLFFAAWAERLDCTAVEWLDKEVFPDPPQGDRRTLDLVGKLRTRQPIGDSGPGETQHWLALVHIEIESPARAKPLRPRMWQAYGQLRREHGLPVLPIGLFLQVGATRHLIDAVGAALQAATPRCP
jgi:hypothetical protein